MTPEEVAKIVKCDLRLMSQSGQTVGFASIKRCVEEIRLCWGEIEDMKDKLKELNAFLPAVGKDVPAHARLWYE